ncbi:MAG: sulfur carrier protein ThiS [Planctomycetes bacterium]|nr:sulfur carrier protein ThiS [Planctomycetota bacterium]
MFLLNGRPEKHLANQTVADLLVANDATGHGVAVERNKLVVPRSEHADTLIEIGDKIEIVRLVGGG